MGNWFFLADMRGFVYVEKEQSNGRRFKAVNRKCRKTLRNDLIRVEDQEQNGYPTYTDKKGTKREYDYQLFRSYKRRTGVVKQ
jgi:hypothetical protein